MLINGYKSIPTYHFMDEPTTPGNNLILRDFWHAALLACGLIGPLIFLVIYFIFGIISPDFDMLRQPIGRLELLNYGWIQSFNFVIFGVFTCLFAFGLRIELQSGFAVNLLPLFHVVAGFGTILLGLYIHEPIHGYVSIILAFSLISGFLLFACRFVNDIRWKNWALPSLLCAVFILVLSMLYWYASWYSSPYAAIFEHVIVVVRLIWLTAFILKLLGGQRLAPAN